MSGKWLIFKSDVNRSLLSEMKIRRVERACGMFISYEDYPSAPRVVVHQVLFAFHFAFLKCVLANLATVDNLSFAGAKKTAAPLFQKDEAHNVFGTTAVACSHLQRLLYEAFKAFLVSLCGCFYNSFIFR